MKRDMDLVRKILLAVEAHPDANDVMTGIYSTLGEYSGEEISHHLEIMGQAGLLTMREWSGRVYPIQVTWEGYEFLDAVRDEARWRQVKTMLIGVKGLAFEATKHAAFELIKRQVLTLLP